MRLEKGDAGGQGVETFDVVCVGPAKDCWANEAACTLYCSTVDLHWRPRAVDGVYRGEIYTASCGMRIDGSSGHSIGSSRAHMSMNITMLPHDVQSNAYSSASSVQPLTHGRAVDPPHSLQRTLQAHASTGAR